MTKGFNRTAANEDPPFVKTVRVSEDFTSVPAGQMRDNRHGLDNIYLGPSLYGDLWVALQRLMNFNFTMVDLSVFSSQYNNCVHSSSGIFDWWFLGIIKWWWILERSCEFLLCSFTRNVPKIFKVGMIHRNEVDIGVTSLFASRQRKNAVDFSRTLQYAE